MTRRISSSSDPAEVTEQFLISENHLSNHLAAV